MSQTSSIGWCDVTWNPINGRCPNNCVDLQGIPYCYMWRKGGIADRFKKVHDHPLRLDEDMLKKIPTTGRVFVGSSTDMWVDQVPDEWLLKILTACADNSNAEFLFLTKKPTRYLRLPMSEFNLLFVREITSRLWFGATWDGTDKTRENINYIGQLSLFGFNTFVSFEPLLSSPSGNRVTLDYSEIKWIIIGADSRKGQPKPPLRWADYLIADARKNGAKVFIKDNYYYPETIKEIPEFER